MSSNLTIISVPARLFRGTRIISMNVNSPLKLLFCAVPDRDANKECTQSFMSGTVFEFLMAWCSSAELGTFLPISVNLNLNLVDNALLQSFRVESRTKRLFVSAIQSISVHNKFHYSRLRVISGVDENINSECLHMLIARVMNFRKTLLPTGPRENFLSEHKWAKREANNSHAIQFHDSFHWPNKFLSRSKTISTANLSGDANFINLWCSDGPKSVELEQQKSICICQLKIKLQSQLECIIHGCLDAGLVSIIFVNACNFESGNGK